VDDLKLALIRILSQVDEYFINIRFFLLNFTTKQWESTISCLFSQQVNVGNNRRNTFNGLLSLRMLHVYILQRRQIRSAGLKSVVHISLKPICFLSRQKSFSL